MSGDGDTTTDPVAATTDAEGNTPATSANTVNAPSYDVPLLEQPSENTCWATTAAMMLSWHDNVCYTIQAAMDHAGNMYRQQFDGDQGLAGSQKPAFLSTLGMRSEPPQDYAAEGLASLLRAYGPLWVTTDEAPDQNFAIHARVLTGISGDGTPDGTLLQINDPADGMPHTETLNVFQQKFDKVAIDDLGTSGNFRVQVVHFSFRGRRRVAAPRIRQARRCRGRVTPRQP